MVRHSHYLLHIVASLQDVQVAVVSYVASVIREEAGPAAWSGPVVILEDVGVGKPKALHQLHDSHPEHIVPLIGALHPGSDPVEGGRTTRTTSGFQPTYLTCGSAQSVFD